MEAAGARKRYYPLLDALRAIAAALILVRHTGNYFGVSFDRSYLAVDLFFVLSGLVVANAYEPGLKSGGTTFWRFVLIRVVRLMPLYYVALVIGVVALLLTPYRTVTGGELAEMTVFGSVLLPIVRLGGVLRFAYPINPPSWSLFFELFINFAYALVVRRLRTWMIVGGVIACGVLLIPLCLLNTRHNVDFGWSVKSFPAGFVRIGYSFGVGLLLYRYAERLPRLGSKRGAQIVLGLAACAATALVLIVDPGKALTAWYDLVAVLIVFPLIVFVGMQVEVSGRASRILAFLGVSSYSIYVLHKPVANLISALLQRSGLVTMSAAQVARTPSLDSMTQPIPSQVGAPWSGIVLLVALLALSWLLDRYFERPLRNAVRNRRPHRPADA